MLGSGRRRRERELRRIVDEVSAAFPMPADDDSEDRWEVYELVDEAQTGLGAGFHRGGFRAAGYNQCVAALDQLLDAKRDSLSARELGLLQSFRRSVEGL